MSSGNWFRIILEKLFYVLHQKRQKNIRSSFFGKENLKIRKKKCKIFNEKFLFLWRMKNLFWNILSLFLLSKSLKFNSSQSCTIMIKFNFCQSSGHNPCFEIRNRKTKNDVMKTKHLHHHHSSSLHRSISMKCSIGLFGRVWRDFARQKILCSICECEVLLCVRWVGPLISF